MQEESGEAGALVPAAPPKGAIPRWFANPWVGFLGTVASMVGLIASFYFYTAGQRQALLTYTVSPSRATVLDVKKVTGLQVLHNGQPVLTDLSAVQVAFWNAGTAPATSDQILQPINLRMDPPVPILEASVQSRTRDLTALALDSSRATEGSLGVAFRILEPGDGGVVQVIYAGGLKHAIRLEGAIEGQRVVAEARQEKPNESRWTHVLNTFLLGPVWVLFLLLLARQVIVRRRTGSKVLDAMDYVFLPLGLLYIWQATRSLPKAFGSYWPPFPF